MEKFTQAVLKFNKELSQIIDCCKKQNITTVQNLILLLRSSFSHSLSQKENNLIALYQHISDSYSKSEQQATQILEDLKKNGVLNIKMLEGITDEDASKLGLNISNALIVILEKEMQMDEEEIQDVLLALKQNGINSRSSLLQLSLEKAVDFGIPKYQFKNWVQENNSGKQNIDLTNFNSIQVQQSHDEQKTQRYYLEKLVRESQKLNVKETNGQSIQFYKYPIYKKVDLKDLSELKTLVFIGETGVGKSTIINFFSNYYIGVQYEDPFRFVIVNETGAEFSKQQAVSQTSEVKEYYLKGFDGKSHLHIIDTPGFGDTKGYEQDDNISKLITNKLQDLDSITLICFVIKATTNRLTIPQKYIMNRILQLFGNDVIQNFMFLFTFSDSEEPQALSALLFNGDAQHSASPVVNFVNKVRKPFWQQFNNAAFSSVGKKSLKNLWDEACEQFKIFYEEKILKTQFVTLSLTKEVIQERKQIQNIVYNIRPDLQRQLNLMDEVESYKKIITNLSKEQENSKDFKFKQTYFEIIKIDLKPNEYVTNCNNCNTTCHYPCAFSNSSDKINCCAMSNGNCTICPNKCNWQNHENMNFRFETEEKIKVVEMDDLKKRYQKSSKEKLTKEDFLQQLNADLNKIKGNCQIQITNLMKSINRLNQIALLPAISNAESDYIEYLIQEEENSKRPGYNKRIEGLRTIQKDFEWLKQEIKKQK